MLRRRGWKTWQKLTRQLDLRRNWPHLTSPSCYTSFDVRPGVGSACFRTVVLVEEPTPAHDDGDSGIAPPDPAVLPKEKRSNEFWLALASIVLALVVSVIAVGSGWYTADQHDKQETIRENVSSTRSQQKDAYTGFINSASDLAIAIQLQVKAIENRYPYFLYTPIPEDKADLEKKFIDFGHTLDLAQLWGSAVCETTATRFSKRPSKADS